MINEDTGIPTLYHRNKGKHKNPLPETSVPNYHLQEKAPHFIPGILKYIVNHDAYKGCKPVVQLPKGPKKIEKRKVPKTRDCKQARAQKNLKQRKTELPR